MARRAIAAEIVTSIPQPFKDIPVEHTKSLNPNKEILSALLELQERYRNWQEANLAANGNNCQNNRHKEFLTRECCKAHQNANIENKKIIAEAQHLIGDTHKHPMSRCEVTAKDPLLLSKEWWELQLDKYRNL